MQVKSFKLVTGEEVVARLVTTTSNMATNDVISYQVDSPQVLSIQAAGGRVGLAFIPWTLSNPDISKLDIPGSAVVVMFDPSPTIEKQYMQETSQLVMP